MQLPAQPQPLGNQSPALAAADHGLALTLVLATLPAPDMYVTAPLVCRAWNAAAAAAYGHRSLSVSSLEVRGSEKTLSLSSWLLRHSNCLAIVHLTGFMTNTTNVWWNSIWSAPYRELHHLSLRGCGADSQPIPFHLMAHFTALRVLKLEHIRCFIEPAAIAACTGLTHLTASNCGLQLQHLAAIGQLQQLVELAVSKNDIAVSTSSICSPAAAANGCCVPSSGRGSTGQRSQQQSAACSIPPQVHEHIRDRHQTTAAWLLGLQQLQHLNLSKCRLPTGTLDDLALVTNLKVLDLSHTQLDVCVGTGPGHQLKLQRLESQLAAATVDRQNCTLALGSTAAASCAVVGRMSGLWELDVSYVTNACEQLCKGVYLSGVLPTLRKLNITGTGCTAEQFQNIVKCFPTAQILNQDADHSCHQQL